jgi:hypothetical protein
VKPGSRRSGVTLRAHEPRGGFLLAYAARMFESCRGGALTLCIVTATAAGSIGCFRVDQAQVRVKDPRAVGVVANDANRWLVPPHGPPETVGIYRNFMTTETLSRSASGSMDYVSEHWALGKRVDATPLVDEEGLLRVPTPRGWLGPLGASPWLEDAVQRDEVVRLPVIYVRQTGPFGTCNGTLFDSCIRNPAVRMSLATDGRNLDEVRVVLTPLRTLGIAELIFGGTLTSAAVVEGVFLFADHSSEARNIALGVGGVTLALGGALIANGLWRVLTPDQRFVYRASN